MEERTRKLIAEFRKEQDTETLLSIFIALHEEEGVSERVGFKNCLRHLRNMAAHEPAMFVKGFSNKYNAGSQKIVFTGADGTCVVLDVVQLLVWMFDMYLKTEEKEYLIFIKAVYQMRYKKALERFAGVTGYDFWMEGDEALLSPYVIWMQSMYTQCGMVRSFGVEDPYAAKLLKENPKVFWKTAIPSMMELACFYMSGGVRLLNKANLKYFIQLYVAREGV